MDIIKETSVILYLHGAYFLVLFNITKSESVRSYVLIFFHSRIKLTDGWRMCFFFHIIFLYEVKFIVFIWTRDKLFAQSAYRAHRVRTQSDVAEMRAFWRAMTTKRATTTTAVDVRGMFNRNCRQQLWSNEKERI